MIQLDGFGAVAPAIRISGDAAPVDGGRTDGAKAALAGAEEGAEPALSGIDGRLHVNLAHREDRPQRTPLATTRSMAA